MKRLHSLPSVPGKRKVACTISAAALMLGVSQAATVGFNFQVNYCAVPSYSGAVVTAPAFGLAPAGWENLSQMGTGYGCTPGYYTLSESINTQTSTGGLNPLPSGSVTVTWSAWTANCSGFGGYSRSGPNYSFGSNGYRPGNEQVYWGFLRDGVNFGPGCVSWGDNNEPGYQVDLVGLQSVFTNGAYVVQLIAGADSMQYLTNAFIIDATAGATQSVVYPSTPPVADVADTAWVRGYGGGLSTVSGPVSSDHLQIIGNRAAHGGDKNAGTGYNWASTIAGFIITDQPVITMSPNSALACGGDGPIVLSAAAAGVPPLGYQWRRNGQPVAGATTSALSFSSPIPSLTGNYDLVVTNLYGQATSGLAALVVDALNVTTGNNYVADSNPNGPAHDGTAQGAVWVSSSTDGAGITRTGVMQFSAASSNQVFVAGQTNLDAAAGTIMFWMRSAGVTDPAGNPAMLFARSAADGLVIIQNTDGTIQFEPGKAPPYAAFGPNVSDNNWHHVAATFDQVGATIGLYVDGVNVGDADLSGMWGSPWGWEYHQPIELGSSAGTGQPSQPYQGLLADVRFYNVVLSDADIARIYQTNALVNPGALILRLNFDTSPLKGITLRWLCPDAVLQSSGAAAGPYSDLPAAFSPYSEVLNGTMKFYRYRGHTLAPVITNPYMM